MAEQAIVLHYFDATGGGECTRLLLTIGGIAFEDKRYPREDFAKAKAEGKFKFGQLPVLEVGGKQYAQSYAIETWAAKKAGLLPTDPLDILRCDESRNLYTDVVQKLVPVFYAPEDQKPALVQKYIETDFQIYAAYAEKLLKQNGENGYFVNDKLTVADIKWYCFLSMHASEYVKGIPKDIFKNYALLIKLYNNVHNHPKVQEWNKAHGQNFDL